MFSENFDPLQELRDLQIENIKLKHQVNQLVQNQNKIQEFMVEFSQQHADLAKETVIISKALNESRAELREWQQKVVSISNQ